MRGKVDFKGTKDGIILYIKGELTFDWIQILVQRKLKLARHFFEGAHIIGSSGYLFTEEQEDILAQLIQAQSGMKVLNLEPYDFKRDTSQKSSPQKSVVQAPPVPDMTKHKITGQMEHSIWGVDQSSAGIPVQGETADKDVAEEPSVENKDERKEVVGIAPKEQTEEDVGLDQEPLTDSIETISAEAGIDNKKTEETATQEAASAEAEAEEDESTDKVSSFAYGLTASHEESSVFVSDTVFHRGTLRSGRRIDSKGNIVVLGDVNPGAELVARGNIIVMGSMRGLAHAGSDGNMDAFVAAIRLMPMQLRIHKVITRPPDEEENPGHNDPQYPEIAYVKDGTIIIEPYL